jgi:hypothetical protein
MKGTLGSVVMSLALFGSCGAIPSCDDVACPHPTGSKVKEFDGIMQGKPQAFTPAGDGMPEDSEGGAARI